MSWMNKSGWTYEKDKLEEAKGLGDYLDVGIERGVENHMYFIPWAIESMITFAENKGL